MSQTGGMVITKECLQHMDLQTIQEKLEEKSFLAYRFEREHNMHELY